MSQSLLTSNSVVPSGYDGPLNVSVSGDGTPEISINGGSWTTSSNMNPGDSVRVRLTSSSSYNTLNQATVTLGSTSSTWDVTTRLKDITPDAFSFTDETGVGTSTLITSNTLTPSGYDGPLDVNVTGDGSPQISVNGGSWTTSTNMSPSESLEVRLTSSSSMNSTYNVTVTLGEYSTTWSATTISAYNSYCWLSDDKSSCVSNFVVDGCGSETVLDGGTGLCWQRDMGGSTMNWTDAQLNCTDSSTAGHSDWYLPSKEELMTLTDLSRSNPAIVGGNNNIFTNVVSNYYWTDTSRGYSSPSSGAWIVYFNNGAVGTGSKTLTNYATCVRRN